MVEIPIIIAYEVYDWRGQPAVDGFPGTRKIAVLETLEEAERFVDTVSRKYPITIPFGNKGYEIKPLEITIQRFKDDKEIIEKLKSVPLPRS